MTCSHLLNGIRAGVFAELEEDCVCDGDVGGNIEGDAEGVEEEKEAEDAGDEDGRDGQRLVLEHLVLVDRQVSRGMISSKVRKGVCCCCRCGSRLGSCRG